MIYIYSTLSSDQNYGTDNGSVFITGQANIMTKHMFTPRGRVTEISDEQYSALKANRVFQLHVKNGFIAVERTKADPEKVATNMEASDQSAPDTPESLEAENKQVPKTNKGK